MSTSVAMPPGAAGADATDLPLSRPDRHDRLETRAHLRTVLVSWAYGAVWMMVANGAAFTQFARALGTPEAAFGVIAALPFLGALMQLPASIYLERHGGRKRSFMVTLLASRLAWVFIGLMPWVMPFARPYWWMILVFMLAMSWMSMQWGGLAWMNWMSDVIPQKIRGRYMADRMRLGKAFGLVVMLGVGYMLDLAQDVSTQRPELMLELTSGLIAIAGLLGTLDVLCFQRVSDPPLRQQKKDVSRARREGPADDTSEPDPWWDTLKAPLANREFRIYLGFVFMLTLATGFLAQYVWLFALDRIGMSNLLANVALIAIPMSIGIAVQGVWGQIVDRIGYRPVLIVGGLLISQGAVGWILVDAGWWILGYGLVMCAVIAWPAIEVVQVNIMLDLANSNRSKSTKGSKYGGGGSASVAIASVTVAVAGILSGLIAAGLAWLLEDFSWTIPVLGNELDYIGVLFLGSGALRLIAVAIAMQMHEPHPSSAGDKLRYMGLTFYSNVRTTITVPARIAAHALRRRV